MKNLLFAAALVSLLLAGCSNDCDALCDHVYGECKATGETVDQCKTKCEAGDTGNNCKNQSAYESCVNASICADINSSDLSANALITCTAKCDN